MEGWRKRRGGGERGRNKSDISPDGRVASSANTGDLTFSLIPICCPLHLTPTQGDTHTHTQPRHTHTTHRDTVHTHTTHRDTIHTAQLEPAAMTNWQLT